MIAILSFVAKDGEGKEKPYQEGDGIKSRKEKDTKTSGINREWGRRFFLGERLSGDERDLLDGGWGKKDIVVVDLEKDHFLGKREG